MNKKVVLRDGNQKDIEMGLRIMAQWDKEEAEEKALKYKKDIISNKEKIENLKKAS